MLLYFTRITSFLSHFGFPLLLVSFSLLKYDVFIGERSLVACSSLSQRQPRNKQENYPTAHEEGRDQINQLIEIEGK